MQMKPLASGLYIAPSCVMGVNATMLNNMRDWTPAIQAYAENATEFKIHPDEHPPFAARDGHDHIVRIADSIDLQNFVNDVVSMSAVMSACPAQYPSGMTGVAFTIFSGKCLVFGR